jgi:hypothetical protein
MSQPRLRVNPSTGKEELRLDCPRGDLFLYCMASAALLDVDQSNESFLQACTARIMQSKLSTSSASPPLYVPVSNPHARS